MSRPRVQVPSPAPALASQGLSALVLVLASPYNARWPDNFLPMTDDLAQLLASWELSLRAGRRSPRTVKSYMDTAERFRAFLASRGAVEDVRAITRSDV